MPINVFGNSNSNDNGNKINTALFVQKLFLRNNFIESNFEEVIDLKNHYRIKNSPNSICIRDACSKNNVENKFNDPSISKNTTQLDFDDKNLNNVRFIKVNSIPTLEEQLTPKLYVDQVVSDGVHESSLLRLDPDEKLSLDEQDSIVLISTLTLLKTIIELPTN